MSIGLHGLLRRAVFFAFAAAAFLSLMACSVGRGVRSAPPAMETIVRMDAAVWLPASQIAWPDASNPSVHVFYSPEAAVRELGLPATALTELRAGEDAIFMGQQGNKLAVLLQRQDLKHDRELRQFLAWHESFHLAAQFYGNSVGFTRLRESSAPENPLKVSEYWRSILIAVRNHVVSTDSPSCPLIQARFGSLSEADRNYVLDRAFWEWPAEYFARSQSGGYENPGRYRAVRSKLSEGINLYVIGSIAMEHVARIHGTNREWQYRISDGESALNVVLDTLGCATVPDNPGMVKVDHVDFMATTSAK